MKLNKDQDWCFAIHSEKDLWAVCRYFGDTEWAEGDISCALEMESIAWDSTADALVVDEGEYSHAPWIDVEKLKEEQANQDDQSISIPKSALRWLLGMEGSFEPPKWKYEQDERIYGHLSPFWWRSIFMDNVGIASHKELEQ